MNGEVKAWLDAELKDFNEQIRIFNKKLYQQMYGAMAGAVIVPVAFGILVGYPLQIVLTRHLPIGVGIALVVYLIYMLQLKNASVRVVREHYEEHLPKFFEGHSDQEEFAAEMAVGVRGVLDHAHTVVDKFPARLMVSPNYMVYCREAYPVLIRMDDVKSLQLGAAEQMKIRTEGVNVRINEGVTSIYINYIDGVKGWRGDHFDRLYFDSPERLQEAIDLIGRYCPRAKGLWEE